MCVCVCVCVCVRERERERQREREKQREREIGPSSTILMPRIVEYFVNNELEGIWK